MRTRWSLRKVAQNLHVKQVATAAASSPSASFIAQTARNVQAQAALAEEFGLRTSADVATLARCHPYRWPGPARRWRSQGRVFAVDFRGETRYPGFQFDAAGRPHPIIARVVETLGNSLSAWELALWFTGANDWLGGRRPVDLLEEQDPVLAAARHLRKELQA